MKRYLVYANKGTTASADRDLRAWGANIEQASELSGGPVFRVSIADQDLDKVHAAPWFRTAELDNVVLRPAA